MRVILASAILGTLLVAAPESQSNRDSRPSGELERPFVSNGRVTMDLSAGEYCITGRPDARIRMEWSVRRGQLSDVRSQAEVRGQEAVISTDGPGGGGSLRARIQVPMRADLHIRMTAGELHIEGVEGNKDIAMHAGELHVDVGRPDDYQRVEASVWAGEVDAQAFGVSKGGLFRSVDLRGDGSYRLDVSLKAGEVRLYSR